MKIFISYRRDDSAVASRLLYKELAERVQGGSVFMDVDNIGYGDDFAAVIDRHLADADVVLVVIGPRWHQVIEQRLRGDDWVRHEVMQALALREVGLRRARWSRAGRPRVLPVILDDTDWPGPVLPVGLDGLRSISAAKLLKADLKGHLSAIVESVQARTFEERMNTLAGDLRLGRLARWAAPALGGLVLLAAWTSAFDLLKLDTELAGLTIAWAGATPAAAAVGAPGVVLVGIDAGTVQAVGRAFGPDWRREHARVVDTAAAAGARTLAFDIFMPAPGDAAADAAFERSLRAAHGRLPVVLAVQAVVDGNPAIAPAFRPLVHWGLACAGQRLARAVLMPLAVQPAAARPDATAAMAASTHAHTITRASASAPYPSLALAAYSAGGQVEAIDAGAQTVAVRVPGEQRTATVDFVALDTVPIRQTACPALGPGDRVASQWVDPAHVAGAGAGFKRLAYQQLLAAEPAAVRAVAGRTVLVGVMLGDDDSLAMHTDDAAFGSQLLAAQIQALHAGHGVRGVGAASQWVWMSLAALAGASVWLRLRQRPAWLRRAGLAGAALAVVAAALLWFRLERQLLPPHHGLAALLVGAGLAAWLAGRDARRR